MSVGEKCDELERLLENELETIFPTINQEAGHVTVVLHGKRRLESRHHGRSGHLEEETLCRMLRERVGASKVTCRSGGTMFWVSFPRPPYE